MGVHICLNVWMGMYHSQAGLYTYSRVCFLKSSCLNSIIFALKSQMWGMVCAFCHQMGKGGALGMAQ